MLALFWGKANHLPQPKCWTVDGLEKFHVQVSSSLWGHWSAALSVKEDRKQGPVLQGRTSAERCSVGQGQGAGSSRFPSRGANQKAPDYRKLRALRSLVLGCQLLLPLSLHLCICKQHSSVNFGWRVCDARAAPSTFLLPKEEGMICEDRKSFSCLCWLRRGSLVLGRMGVCLPGSTMEKRKGWEKKRGSLAAS